MEEKDGCGRLKFSIIRTGESSPVASNLTTQTTIEPTSTSTVFIIGIVGIAIFAGIIGIVTRKKIMA